MPKKAFTSIFLQRSNRRASLQAQLAAGLREAIASGALKSGAALPSSRDLATDLSVSRNTVIAAYDQLIGEGYLDARPRSGVFVSDGLATAPLPRFAAPASGSASTSAPKLPPPRLTGPAPFRPCQPDVRLFPVALWSRLRSRALASLGPSLLQYQDKYVLGLPALRRSLAEYLRDSRGVRCSWHQVAVTSGSQQALFLLAQLLARPGRRIWIEDPGYPGAREAFRRAGAALCGAPVDNEGVVAPADWEGAAAFYTTPSRQFPTGACLPVARRLELVERARTSRTWIIEDDYDSEFRYSRPPLPSLSSLDTAGRVIYVGSMSKVLAPGLRIGYVVLPEELADSFAMLRSVVDDHGSLVDQAALSEFIATGAFYSHIRKCRKVYGERLATFLEGAQALDWPLEFPHTDGGMNLTGFLPPSENDRAWSEKLAQAGLDVPPLSRYSLGTTRRGLLFGFTAFDRAAIKAGLKRAAAAI